MLVSVVIPVHNRRTLIVPTVRSALAQTCAPAEVIVVDDGSDDGTADVVAATFGDAVRLIRLPSNQGRSIARNTGWAAARGELVALLDSDDLWLRDKLARQVPHFADPSVALVHARIAIIDSNDTLCRAETVDVERAFDVAERRGYDYNGITATWCRMYTSTVVLRRELLETTGGFDPSLSQFEDWDLFWRVILHGRVVTLRDTLVHYRVHRGNTPLRWAVDASPWLHVMQKHLAALPSTPSLRRARHNLLLNLSLGEYWRGNRAASRAWMRQALQVSLRPLGHPAHPVWSAPLLHTVLPAFAANQLIRMFGVDAYQRDRVPDSTAPP